MFLIAQIIQILNAEDRKVTRNKANSLNNITFNQNSKESGKNSNKNRVSAHLLIKEMLNAYLTTTTKSNISVMIAITFKKAAHRYYAKLA